MFSLYKHALINRVLPNQDNEPASIIKAMHVLKYFSDQLARDTVSTIVNNVHHGAP
jgi:hypothetical protein